MARTLVKTIAGTPIGAIEAFGGDIIPDGWALCDGSTLSRTEYASLFAIIGTAHGHGTESSPGVSDGTRFHLPDLRGRFLRGTDNGTGRDDSADSRTASNAGGNTGDAVGSVQDDQMQRMTGSISKSRFGSGGSGSGVLRVSGSSSNAANGGGSAATTHTFDSLNSPNSRASATTDGETRPRNANVNYIIKIE